MGEGRAGAHLSGHCENVFACSHGTPTAETVPVLQAHTPQASRTNNERMTQLPVSECVCSLERRSGERRKSRRGKMVRREIGVEGIGDGLTSLVVAKKPYEKGRAAKGAS